MRAAGRRGATQRDRRFELARSDELLRPPNPQQRERIEALRELVARSRTPRSSLLRQLLFHLSLAEASVATLAPKVRG